MENDPSSEIGGTPTMEIRCLLHRKENKMETKEFLTQDWVKQEIISRLNYNPETGSLVWASRGCKFFDGERVGKDVGYTFIKGGYTNKIVSMEIKGKKVSLVVARLCWLVQTGDWPKNTIDHIDRDSLNNKWDNLRDVTQCENNQNKSSVYKKKPLDPADENWYQSCKKTESSRREAND